MDKTLTKAEEQIMLTLWKIQKGFLKDILLSLPEGKPHANTVATILKILVKKGFVGINTFSRLNQYFPLVSKEIYIDGIAASFIQKYFDGSPIGAVSYIMNKHNVLVKDVQPHVKISGKEANRCV